MGAQTTGRQEVAALAGSCPSPLKPSVLAATTWWWVQGVQHHLQAATARPAAVPPALQRLARLLAEAGLVQAEGRAVVLCTTKDQ